MPETENTIASLSATIRAYVLAPSSPDTPDLKPLADSFLNALNSVVALTPHNAAPIAETVLTLYHILQSSKDSQVIRICLHALLRSGRFGRILVTRFVHDKSVPLRELAAIVATFPADDRLALAHEMLLDYPGSHDKQTLSWLEGIMAPLATTDPEDIAPFIASLGRQGESLAFPARQVLMNGVFGEWLRTNLETGASDHALTQLCDIIIALGEPEHAKTLAVSISVGFVAPTLRALQAIAMVADSGSKAVLDMFVKTLKTAKNGLVGICLDGIIAQHSPATGKLLATIRAKMPSARHAATIRVPLLGDTAYTAYLTALPADQRTKAESEAFSALLAIAPDFVESLSRAGTTKGRIMPVANGTNPSPPGGNEPISPDDKTPGFFARLFKPRRKTLEKLLPESRNIRDEDLQGSALTNEELDGRELTGLNLALSTFAEVTFIRSKIATSTLTGSTFTDGSATGCTFDATDFSGADFTNINFTKCTFNTCTFTNTAFTNCTFHECRFRNCIMGGSAWLGSMLRLTGITTSVLSGASFYETKIRSCRFIDVDLTCAEFTATEINGMEFINCVIYSASILHSTFHAVDMPHSSVFACRIHNSDLPHALFLTDRVRQLAACACELEHATLPDPKIIPHEAAGKILVAWSRELTFLRREARMVTCNRRRLGLALRSLPREKQNYFSMLPYLIATDIFEQKFNLDSIPACSVWGYNPGLTTLELCRQFFPGHKPGKRKPDVRILAIYAMGSLGTVAQTPSSDLDCWVCYDGDISLDAETGLKRKLDALGLWAESEFGLEAHFFPMRMDDIRDNHFSSGDEESSGSAQAILLKEEFYRTALRIAGKNIAWWVTPAGANKATYDACIQAARRYPLSGQPRLEDFGYLAPVPPDEYFGGSLWQMVKAVHSPFKSVLKLGLLETYADPATSHLALCDSIKQNLFMNRRGVRRTDPYAVLFNTLRSYYAGRGDTEAARLLTESFKFKANLCDIPFFRDLPARYEDASLIVTLFGEGYTDPEKVCNSNVTWTFDKSLKMGASVRSYMVNTYQRIQAGLSKAENSPTDTPNTLINAQDLTRLGRRIGANFSQKKHKVMRVPFMDAKGAGFRLLHFSAEKAPGKRPIWVVRGGSQAEAKKSADSLQLLHRSGDPVHLLAWLLANRIYNPNSLLQADRTVAPIAVTDLQKLMPALHDFFPFTETFERDINEGLNPERVTRIFLIVNLTSPPDAQKVEQVAVIYATNWGEMFCRTFLKPDATFEKLPSRFLANHLDHPIVDIPEMLLFFPKGSQCKRFNLM